MRTIGGCGCRIMYEYGSHMVLLEEHGENARWMAESQHTACGLWKIEGRLYSRHVPPMNNESRIILKRLQPAS